MKKVLLILITAAICAVVAIRYFHPDFAGLVDASDGGSSPIADMDQPLPHAVLSAIGGDWVDLSAFKGQVVYISFFATWCPGCVDEVPDLIRLQEEFKDKGFTVVAIAVNDEGEESLESFVKKRVLTVNGNSVPINFPVLLGSIETAQKLGFEGGLPAGVLVTRDGREVKVVRGVVSEAALSKAIRKLIKN